MRDIPIIATPFQVGRRAGLSFCIPSQTVSNVHAEFLEREGTLVLRDLGSTNGTYVNGEKISGREVRPRGRSGPVLPTRCFA